VRHIFDPKRLTLAREFKGWTKAKLGDRADITGAAVGQFERGVTTPNSGTITRMASALEVPVTFFSVSAGTTGSTEVGAYFRSLRSTTLTERRRARAVVQCAHQVVAALEQKVRLPDCDVPHHPVDPTSEDWDEIERAAAATRAAWGLDASKPLPNVVRLLEQHGIVVIRNYLGEKAKVDAFSVPFVDRALVVLSAEKGKHDRSRFDAAHELGHLVMHRNGQEGTKQVEAQAHRFAGAFLMPREGILHELPSTHRDLKALLRLKQKWGASVGAILRRSKDLGRMQPDQYTNAMKALSARGWRKDEPGSLPPEEPTLLRRAIEVADEAGTPIKKLASEAALNQEFVEQLVERATDSRRPVTF
jgi:Zn-dependent peptidase ImmA (M78 family)/transcriptional regulator with XRE-family HTH domain